MSTNYLATESPPAKYSVLVLVYSSPRGHCQWQTAIHVGHTSCQCSVLFSLLLPLASDAISSLLFSSLETIRTTVSPSFFLRAVLPSPDSRYSNSRVDFSRRNVESSGREEIVSNGAFLYDRWYPRPINQARGHSSEEMVR